VLTTLLSLLVVLGVLIFVHEAGHFVAAKWAGIYVHRFSLGLGSPVRWLTFRRGETEYSISWLPLGGYVKMASAEEDATSAALEGGNENVNVPPDRMFEAKPVWKRMIVILAGVTMNAIFAWLVFSYLAGKHGRQIDPVTTVGVVVDSLVPKGAEILRTLKAGDRIVSVEGEPVTSWGQIQGGIATAAGATIELGLADGRQLVVPIHSDALEQRLQASQAVRPFRAPVIGRLLEGYPAATAGIQPGDTILGIAGAPVRQWYDLQRMVEGRSGQPLELEVARAGQRLRLSVTPRADSVPSDDGRMRPVGRLGVDAMTDFRSEPYTFTGALGAGWDATVEASTTIARTVRGLFSGRVSKSQLGGPIAIGQMAGQSARMGLDSFLGFMAFISINLAVLNMLPVPVLDGGQFLFLLAEAVLRRPLPLRLRERLTAVGLLLIFLLTGLAFWNDIRRLVEAWTS
jgi:regulator of sigma E protease